VGDIGGVRLDLYSAPGCTLCDVALEALAPLAAELGFAIRVVDISGDPDLERRYRSRLPVAEVGGRTVFKYRVDESRVRELVAWAEREDSP
jgi:thioredoxin reductase (NADPH)